VRLSNEAIVYAVAALLGAMLLLTIEESSNRRVMEVLQYGYEPDPQGAAAFAESLPNPTFSQAAPDAMEKAEPQDTFLWRAMDAAHRARYGSPFKVSNQGSVGSCVAHGAAHALYASESVAWSIGERSEPPMWASQASIYGGSRCEIRSKQENRGGDGSTGYHAAKWLKEYGVIYAKPYPSVDCTDNSPSRCKDWGRYGNGGKGNTKLDQTAKETPARYVTKVSNWDELVAAICTGNAVTIASSQGFSKACDEDSFLSPRGTWMHQMALVGIKVTGRQGACVMNSWGGEWLTYPDVRWPEDLPDGCFWADRKVIERILSQQDSWAISEVAFKYRDIHHNNWLEQ
jgi:hypothetical protein